MDAFDQLPSRRPTQRTNSPLATPAPFTFNGPQDMPKGMTLQETPGGFKAMAPVRSGLMVLIYGGMSFFLMLMLASGFAAHETPLGYMIFVGAGLAVTLPILLFYLFGREGIEIDGDRLKLRKTFFGLGFPKSMAWRSIERVQVRRRSLISKMPEVGLEELPTGNLAGNYLEIESATHIKTMGANLKDQYLYFMRYLIIEAVKSSRARR